jgi:hypothetical protein
MTSSETPTDDDEEELASAVAREANAGAAPRSARDSERVMRYAVVGVGIASGWGFILWAHNWRYGAPVFFLWLGWFAVVAGVHYLWRTGTATADPSDEDAAWWRPTGAREELEREKRSLLKAIKEVEFDHQTGKMSERDAQAMTRVYRARAIEVIKAIDELDATSGRRSVRQQIERELKARIAIDGQAKKGEAAAERKKKGKGGGHKKVEARKPADEKKPADENEKKAEATKAEEPKAEEPKAEEPKAEEPKAAGPKADAQNAAPADDKKADTSADETQLPAPAAEPAAGGETTEAP